MTTIELNAARGDAPESAARKVLNRIAKGLVTHVLPPLVILGLLLLVWQMLGSRPGAALPAPSKVVQDTWELISHPFYDRGGNDVGIAWQLLASHKRVAYGYSIAVVVGVSLGVLVGQSTWALRGLDPIFQVLRTVPPLA
jgi:nitrate/nitrite transport system permease protein